MIGKERAVAATTVNSELWNLPPSLLPLTWIKDTRLASNTLLGREQKDRQCVAFIIHLFKKQKKKKKIDMYCTLIQPVRRLPFRKAHQV